ncbi:MAG TPA: DUF4214 domain-containing protein [Usitatibacter sp.]|nr:DUF4214 domain-containing protein [Usitatibacter sp.]
MAFHSGALAAPMARLPSPDLSGLSFTSTGLAHPPVRVLAIEADGSYLIGGGFNAVNGQPRNGLARITSTNQLDSWQPQTPAGFGAEGAHRDSLGRWLVWNVVVHRVDAATGASEVVYTPPPSHSATAVTTDLAGNIYVGTTAAYTADATLAYVHKVSPGGVRDPLFEVVLSGDLGCYILWFTHPRVNALAHDGVDFLYIGGNFTGQAGAEGWGRPGIARVATVAPASANGQPPDLQGKATPGCIGATSLGTVHALTVGRDGFLYAAGGFGLERRVTTATSSTPSEPMGQFGPQSRDMAVTSMALDLPRHRVYVSGYFSTVNGAARAGLAALSTLPDRSLDLAWEPPAGIPYGEVLLGSDRLVHARHYLDFAASTANLAESVAAYPLAGRSLMGHYYRSILGRDPDPSGISFWPAEVNRLATLGIDPREAYVAMAMYFFGSPEFLAAPLSDEHFVERLYLTFFDRPVDPSGKRHWSEVLASGLTREMVMFAFMFSPEFESYMASALGAWTIRPEVAVVVDFYRGALGRLPDHGGLRTWVNAFRTAQCLPAEQRTAAVQAGAQQISSAFFNSAEYLASSASNRDFVTDLYNAFMRRGADVDGFNQWVGALTSGGSSRDEVRLAFLGSPEFAARIGAVAAASCTSPVP